MPRPSSAGALQVSWRSIAVASIALAPYPTVLLPFQASLWVQGGSAAAIVAIALASGVGTLVRRLSRTPPAIAWGLGLYAAAALYGGLVGVLSDNPTRYVATQMASMLLIPVAFLAFTSAGPLRAGELATGLGMAGGIALAVHVVAFLGPDALLPPAGEPVRFVLRNDVGMSGVAVLGLVIALAWWWATRRRAAAAAAVSLGLLVAGSMSRGAWLAAILGVAAWAALARVVRLRSLAVLALGAAVLLAALAVAAAWVARRSEWGVQPELEPAEVHAGAAKSPSKEALLVSTPSTADRWVQLVDGPASGIRGVEIEAWLQGEPGQHSIVSLVGGGADGDGHLVEFTSGYPGRGGWVPVHLVKRLPTGVQRVRLRVWTSGGTWLLGQFHIHLLRDAPEVWLRAVWLRLVSIASPLSGPGADGTLQYRLREWRAVRAVWERTGPGAILAGHGLGATFAFANSGWNTAGVRVTLPTASYIHNFYIFLGFKLGLGGVAALAGLLLVVGWTLREVAATAHRGGESWLLGAMAAAWLAYLAWSISSPEILDFRIAPLWGAAVAASVAAARGARSAPSDATPRPRSAKGIDTHPPAATIEAGDH